MSYRPSEETGQSIMNMDTNEITINRIVGFEWDEAGTDLEDEMPTPVLSPTQIIVPVIPPAGTADPFGRGDGFDLDLAKVMCDVSVIPSLISPLPDVEVPPCSIAAEYAAPATPALETVLESPGYTVPEESGFTWIPGFVPVSEVVLEGEGGYYRTDTRRKRGWRPRSLTGGARPRTMEFDRPVDGGLGATLGGVEDEDKLRNGVVPVLRPEQQIQQEEEVQTPPQREPRRNEGHQPRGPQVMTDESVLGPGDLAGQRKEIADRHRPNNEWSPVAALEDTVSRMQRYLDELQTENRFLRTPRAPVPLVRQAALTTTKVPWTKVTSWEQYQQVFDAIVLSNGWGDATAALQLLSHLQDDALSVALLKPMPLQASRKELTDALSSHYGSPGRLANYRREFDKTVRKRGEDPSNFTITLETLAAFGNMGQTDP